jgi:hypothetical protein
MRDYLCSQLFIYFVVLNDEILVQVARVSDEVGIDVTQLVFVLYCRYDGLFPSMFQEGNVPICICIND